MKYKLALRRVWFHPKFKQRPFTGSFKWTTSGDRVFILANGKRQIAFESAFAAKKQGWVLKDQEHNNA